MSFESTTPYLSLPPDPADRMEVRTQRTFTFSTETTTISIPEGCPREFSRKIWSQNLDNLKRFVHPDPLFKHLVAKGLLTQDQQTEFHDRATFIQKRDLVLEAVPKCSHDDYLFRFIDCLKATSKDNQGHTDLMKLLVNSIAESSKEGLVFSVEKRSQQTMFVATGETMTFTEQAAQPHNTAKHPGEDGLFAKCCTKRWIALYVILSLVLTVAGCIVIIALSQTPSVSLTSIRPRYISEGVTISLDFGVPTKWVGSFTLALDCTSRITIVEGATCEELPTSTRFVPQNESGLTGGLLLYLLPGSFINITARLLASEVLIIRSIETYLAFANRALGTSLFDCLVPPDNTVCHSATQSGPQLPVFNVTEPDFYSIVTRPAPFQQDFTYQNISYNLQMIRQDFEVRDSIVSSRVETLIQVAEFLDLRDKCVLVTPDCEMGSSPPIMYQSVVRRQDVLLVPVLVTIAVISISVALVSLAHFVYTWRKNTASFSKTL